MIPALIQYTTQFSFSEKDHQKIIINLLIDAYTFFCIWNISWILDIRWIKLFHHIPLL